MEAKKIIIDLTDISRRMGIKSETVTLPNGRVIEHVEWTKEDFLCSLAYLDEYRASVDAEAEYFVTNSPAPWVTVGVVEYMKPVRLKYMYPVPGMHELEVGNLRRGFQENNFDVLYELSERDDGFLELYMSSDRDEAGELGEHTFDPKNLYSVMIPEVPADKHILINAKGMYCVMVSVALSLANGSASIWISSHDSDFYCGYSTVPEYAAGDAMPCLRSNNLPGL